MCVSLSVCLAQEAWGGMGEGLEGLGRWGCVPGSVFFQRTTVQWESSSGLQAENPVHCRSRSIQFQKREGGEYNAAGPYSSFSLPGEAL